MEAKLSTASTLSVSSRWTRSACLIMESFKRSTSPRNQSLNPRKSLSLNQRKKKKNQTRVQNNPQLSQLTTKVPQRNLLKARALQLTQERQLIKAPKPATAQILMMANPLNQALTQILALRQTMVPKLMMVLQQVLELQHKMMVALLLIQALPLSLPQSLKKRKKMIKMLTNPTLKPEQTPIQKLTLTLAQTQTISHWSHQSSQLRSRRT